MASKKDSIIKDSFIYSASNYISIFMGLFISIMAKRLLGLSGAGYWALLAVVQTYGMYAGLGIKDALTRELPQAMGAGDEKKAKRLQDATFSYIIMASLAGLLIIWALSFLISKDPVFRAGMRITGILVLATHLYNLMLTILRSKKRFSLIGRLIILNTVFIAIFPLAGAYLFNIIGYAAGMVISTVLSFWFAMSWSGTKFSFSADWALVRRLIKVGSVMLIASIIFKTFLSIDRIMIGRMLSVEELGLYTIGLMAIQQVGALPRFFSIVIFPHIQERYGATKKIADLKGMILRPTFVISRLVPFIIAALIFLIEPLVYYALPQFRDGLGAMKILMFGYFFMVANEMASTFVFTINKQNFFIPFYVILVILNIGFNYAFIHSGFGIEGVAVGTSLSYFCFFVIIFSFAIRHLMPPAKVLRLHLEILIFYVYFLLNFLWIDRFIHAGPAIITAPLRLFCLLLIGLPVLIEIERREAVFSSTFRIIRSRLACR